VHVEFVVRGARLIEQAPCPLGIAGCAAGEKHRCQVVFCMREPRSGAHLALGLDGEREVLLGLVGFALIGVVFVAYGFRRQQLVERAVARSEYVRPTSDCSPR
jgi:hypothetical protein